MIICMDVVEIDPNRLEVKKMSNDNDMDTNHYELKLFQMFKSCDTYQNGFLDEFGLSNLCRLLELQDNGFSLISSLTPHLNNSLGITFEQFREALLQFLGTEADNKPLISKEYLENEQSLNISDEFDNNKCIQNDKTLHRTLRKDVCDLKTEALKTANINNDDDALTFNDLKDVIRNGERLERRSSTPKGSDHIIRSSSQSDMYIIEMESYFERFLNDSRITKRSSSMPVQKSTNSKTSTENSKVSSNNFERSSVSESMDMTFQLDVLSAKDLIKIWDQAQIPNGKSLLSSLGIDEEEINLKQLYKIFEDELRSLESNSPSNLTHALIALQSAELAVLRQAVRQYKDENTKLHADNKDANRRAAMLAAEIDECHTSLEDRSKKELQLLEQRHSLAIRDLNLKLSNDREKWCQQTAELGTKIKSLEKERLQLASDIENLQKENSDLFTETHKLQKQNIQLSKQNAALRSELESSDINKTGVVTQFEDIVSKEEVKSELLAKINRLQTENASIRDKNDELLMEVENLNAELDRLKMKSVKKSASSPNIHDLLNDHVNDIVNLKNVPESDESLNVSFSGLISKNLKVELNSKENNDTRNSSDSDEDRDRGRDRDRDRDLLQEIKDLKEKLKIRNDASQKQEIVEEKCKELESSLDQMQQAYEDCEEYWANKLAEERQLYEDEQSENDKKFTELMEKVREYEEQFKKDGRLSPIDEKDALEQQYEALENENEKILIELNEKDNEIECLKNENSDLRLRLGESVEILTGASEMNNEMMANHLAESPAATPINYLWNQSTIQEPILKYELENFSRLTDNTTNSSEELKRTSRNLLSTTETSKFSTNPVENTVSTSTVSPAKDGNYQAEAVPQENDHVDCDSLSTASGKSFETHSISSSHSIQPAHSISSQQSLRNTFKDELKRLKYFEISLKDQINDLTLQRDGLIMELQQLHEAKPVLEKSYARAAHPSLWQRLNQAELRNRHMENVIKQQQQYAENLMQQTWQHQIELNELQATIEQQKHLLSDHSHRLQSADIVIKDLYVENSHLASTIQRLEQQKSRETYLHQQQRQCLNTMSGLP